MVELLYAAGEKDLAAPLVGKELREQDYYWVTDGQIVSSLLTGKTPNLPFVIQRMTAYGK